MAIRSFQRSNRFTKNEWDAVIEAAEKAELTPGAFVRKAAARRRPTISISTAAA